MFVKVGVVVEREDGVVAPGSVGNGGVPDIQPDDEFESLT